MTAWLHDRDTALPLDMMIANAGIGGKAALAPVSGETSAQAREILATNTLGVINAVTPVLPSIIARQRGHLVLVGSNQALIGMPQSPAYCASKAAIMVYGDGLRRLAARSGVRVTNVLPGFIDTPMSRSLALARPWCWPVDRAARRIARDVGRGAARSIFPLPLRLAIGFGNLMPTPVADAALSMLARSFPVGIDTPDS